VTGNLYVERLLIVVVATTEVTETVSVVPTVVVKSPVDTAVATTVVVRTKSKVLELYLVSVVSLYRVTYAVEVGLVIVDHVVVG
jgi:hypothetical protein